MVSLMFLKQKRIQKVNIKAHNLIIAILLITIGVMGWKIYDLKQSSEELKQFSVETGVECIKNSKTMTKEEIEYCLPVMKMLGFKYKNETEEDQIWKTMKYFI